MDPATTNGHQSRVAVQTSGLLALTVPSLLAGLLLELVLARTYGSSSIVDAFRVASLVYLFALNLFFAHLIPHVVVPVFSFVSAQNGAELAWKLILSVNSWLGYCLAGPLIVACAKPQVLLNILAPSMASAAGSDATLLVRASVISFALLLISGTLTGALHANGIFWPSAVAPTLISVSTIVCVVASRPELAAEGLAAGLVLGSLLVTILHVLHVYSLSSSYGVRLRHWIVPLFHSQTAEFARGFSPLALAALSGQMINILVFRSLTGVAVGAAALYGYALKLTHFIYTPSAKFSTVVFPHLARTHAAATSDQLYEILARSARVVLLVALPSAAVFWILRHPLVSALYGTSKLTSTDLAAVGNLFGILLLASPLGALTSLLTKACAARHRTVFPFLGAVVALLIVVLLIHPLSSAYGAYGVAVAWVLGSAGNVVVLLLWGGVPTYVASAGTIQHLVRVLLVSGASGVAAEFGLSFTPVAHVGGVQAVALLVLLTSLSFAIGFACSILLRVRESLQLLRFAARCIGRYSRPLQETTRGT